MKELLFVIMVIALAYAAMIFIGLGGLHPSQIAKLWGLLDGPESKFVVPQ